jgi:hypothetical protein
MLRTPAAQILLALVSFALALGLLFAEAVDAGAVGGPIGVAIAVLFALNGSARLWVWRHARR